ncbi:MAG: phosphoglycerate mutase family protein [Kiritimatiellae bacterium]|nr:phosphoglycerate mutase family protein [Kiritimatiellia bacterium]
MLDVNALNVGDTVCALIRHGEKDDSHFVLTEKGKSEIERIGLRVSAFHKPVRLYASPESRCVETAVLMGKVIYGSVCDIQTSSMLGKPGVQVKNEEKYSLLTDCMRCRDVYREWKMGLHRDAMQTSAFIRKEIRRFLRETCLQHGITLYISQSGTIACAGYSLGLTDYKADDEDWVKFLDGFVLEL